MASPSEQNSELERLRSYFDASSAGIFVYDEDGVLVDINATACALHGRSRAEMLAAAPQDFIAPESHAIFDAFREVVRAGRTFRGEAIGLRPDGSRFAAEVEGRLLELSGRRLLFSSIIDITERKALEEQARQRQRLETVGELAAGVAHDFNNLLTVIEGHAVLASERPIDASVAEDLRAITSATERAGRLTRYLLAFSSQQALAVQPLDLCAMVETQCAIFRRVFPANIHIALDKSATPCLVDGDPALLELVLLNLCLNAKQAMPRGGTLAIEVKTEAPPLTDPSSALSQVLRIADSGDGMDEVTLARIFEPFFTTRSRGIGTGLGLAMVHGAVRQHDGTIEVRSTPGTGSEFIIRLPPSRRASPDPLPRREASRPGGGERVLLVEDDAGVRAVIAGMVRRLNYRVEVAATGAEALLAAEREEPAIALLDLMLPDSHGPEVLLKLRERYPGLPAVFVSGYAESEIRHRIDDIPDVRCLVKPVKMEALGGELRTALDAPRA